MKKLIVITAILALFAPVYADEAQNSAAVTFEAALTNLLDKNEAIKQAELGVAEAEALVELTYGQFDLFLTGGINYLESKTEATSPFSPEKTDVFSYDVGLTNKLFTGGYLSLDFSYSKTGLTYAPFDPMSPFPIDPSLLTAYNPTFTPTLSLTYVQPLLKNFWGRPDETAIKIGEYSVKLAKEGLKSSILEQVAKLKESYYLIYMLELMLKVSKDFYYDAEKFYKQAVELKKIGLKEQKDILQTKASVLNSKAEIAPAENNLKAAKEGFLSMAGYDPEKWDEIDVKVSGDIEDIYIPENLAADLEDTLIDMQPGVVMSKHSIDMQKMYKQVAENESLPELNLVGSYGIEGTAGDVGGSYEKMFSNDYNNFMLGVQLSYAFPNRASSGSIKDKEADLEKLLEGYSSLKKGMKIMVRDAYRRLLTTKGDYELKKEAKSLQKQRLAIEEKNFKQGRITTQQLLMAQTDYNTSRMVEIGAFYEYMKAVNTWNKITGKYDNYYNNYVNKGEK